MSEHLPEPDPDFPDPGRKQRDIGGDPTWIIIAGLLVALLALVGSGRL